ncbi:DUF305 domain-containing protein [Streptomyces avermitilis]|uniref:DUF305 domain-containing protein n=1 Tax=Streptomyces avermitilis TaxID=33903 RepID=UPI0033A95AE6
MFTSPRSSAPRRALVAAGTAAVLALTLAACGSGDSKDSSMPGMHHGSGSTAGPSSSASSSPSSTPSSTGRFNNADVTFAQQMIPHHQQAVEMAQLADGRASDQDVKDLAAAIEKAQDPEISTMRGWLKSWGKPSSSTASGMPGMHHGAGVTDMAGMMSDEHMTALKAAQGAAFDKMFAQMMIDHHEGAITMAEDERKSGRSADAKRLAGTVITNQTAEIAKMNRILDRL